MTEKRLSEEELEKVNGGLSERDFAKYYCVVTYWKKEIHGYSMCDKEVGPYNTIEEAETAGLNKANEYYAMGNFNISYQAILKLYTDVLERYAVHKYIPR